jgi:stage II sporulation protein D
MKFFYTLLIVTCSLSSVAQQIKVGVFNQNNTRSVVFSVVQGSYLLTCDNQAILTIGNNKNLLLSHEGDSVRCFSSDKNIGLYKTIQLSAMNDSCIFSLRPIDPEKNIRFYDDNLELTMKLGKLQTINIVDLDKYIAGVVEAEGGFKASLEYYKTQAVLCRTYSLSHLNRHTEEGFFVCDGVHCQAFNGRCSGTPAIIEASFETRGLVVTDADSTFITAAFYSNCGGETETAQNVWLTNKPYLKSIKDPYCQGQKNSKWEKKLSLDQWVQYLNNNGFKIKLNASPSSFNFTQYDRKQYYKIGKDSITFRKIRSDFNFHSAYFSLEAKDGYIEIHGRGYGHGVGLCQEGAMQMSKLGYNFREIIQFYYQGVNVTNFRDISVSKNPTLKLLN